MTPIKELEKHVVNELGAGICGRYGEVGSRCLGLMRAAHALHRHYENACNRERLKCEEQDEERVEALVREHCKALGIRATFNGDPRGYPVKVHFTYHPHGVYNTWGGAEDGWGIG